VKPPQLASARVQRAIHRTKLGENKANVKRNLQAPCAYVRHLAGPSESVRQRTTRPTIVPLSSNFELSVVTRDARGASFPLKHIVRAADSLPAAGEPVWYSYHVGSRRTDITIYPLPQYRHIIIINEPRSF